MPFFSLRFLLLTPWGIMLVVSPPLPTTSLPFSYPRSAVFYHLVICMLSHRFSAYHRNARIPQYSFFSSSGSTSLHLLICLMYANSMSCVPSPNIIVDFCNASPLGTCKLSGTCVPDAMNLAMNFQEYTYKEPEYKYINNIDISVETVKFSR